MIPHSISNVLEHDQLRGCLLNGTNHAWSQADQAFTSVSFTGSCGYTFESRFADIRLI